MSEKIAISLEVLPHGEGLALPDYQTDGAAGMDLLAALADDAPLTIKPGDRFLVPTGLKLAIPPGYEAQVRPRSGLALKAGLTILNAPGTIDSDYRGELMALLVNLGSAPPYHPSRRPHRAARDTIGHTGRIRNRRRTRAKRPRRRWIWLDRVGAPLETRR